MAKFKQACFAYDLSKKFQIFTAVYKLNVLNSAVKLLLSNLSPNLSTYLISCFFSIPLRCVVKAELAIRTSIYQIVF